MTAENEELASLEARLQALELQCGLSFSSDMEKDQDSSEPTTASVSLQERLERLETSYYQHKTTPELLTLWNESSVMYEELSAGTALTHQQQVVAPILYRKQELLATSTDFKEQMRELQSITQLLAKDQTVDKNWTDEQVISAPLLTETSKPIPEAEQERLQKLIESMLDLQERTVKANAKVDSLLQLHYDTVLHVSEKLVWADQALRDLEKTKKQQVQ